MKPFSAAQMSSLLIELLLGRYLARICIAFAMGSSRVASWGQGDTSKLIRGGDPAGDGLCSFFEA